ncbi:MAG: outer membrane beta-barrel protein [Bacteroidota bacterium]
MLRKPLVFSLLLLSVCLMMAQNQKAPVKIGVGLTGNNYIGDYNDPSYFRTYAGSHLSIQKANRRSFNLHLQAGFGRFADQFDGDDIPLDQDGQPLPRFIETSFIHGELAVSYRLFPAKRLQPYAQLGYGLMFFSPKDNDGRRLIRFDGPASEGAATNQIVPQLSGSLGLEARVNDFISFNIAYTYRFLPTDYLDNYGQEEGISGFDALQSVQVGFMFSLGRGPALPPRKQKPPKDDTGVEIIDAGKP